MVAIGAPSHPESKEEARIRARATSIIPDTIIASNLVSVVKWNGAFLPFTDGFQITLLCGRRVRFLDVAGLCKNFAFTVDHFQTSF